MDGRTTKKPPAPIDQGPEHKELLLSFRKIAGTEDGVRVLRYLMDKCGYKETSVYLNHATGDILKDQCIWNEARRELWLSLRKMIPKGRLNVIEMER